MISFMAAKMENIDSDFAILYLKLGVAKNWKGLHSHHKNTDY